MKRVSDLPENYKILPFSIPFRIKGFIFPEEAKTFSPANINIEDWYNQFCKNIYNKIGQEFYPVCRISDGEFEFLFGRKAPSRRASLLIHLRFYLSSIKSLIIRRHFTAFTRPGISSGKYRYKEIKEMQDLYRENLIRIADSGVLAIHLSYHNKPFQEQYFPDFKKWVNESGLKLNTANYYPFYFVYAFFSSPIGRGALKDRKILLVHSAVEDKREKIESTLYSYGAKEIKWLTISSSKSLFDKIDPTNFIGNVDICLVGAGIGKPNVIVQLEPLSVPCIDVGFLFEVFSNNQLKHTRPFCDFKE